MAAAIPTLADPPSRQMVQAIVDPIGFYRRCFRAHNGVVRVHMVPGLSPQQVLINDPAVLQELMGRENGRGISAPGHLNDLMEQVVGQHSLMLLEPAPHRARRRLLTPPFHGERLKAYGALIQSIARQVFAELAPGQVWDARTQMQRITMRVILSAVFGLHEGVRPRLPDLHRLLRRNSPELQAGAQEVVSGAGVSTCRGHRDHLASGREFKHRLRVRLTHQREWGFKLEGSPGFVGSHRHAERNVGVLGIHIHTLQLGPQHQIHVLHRDGAKQHLVAQHHRTGEAAAVAEAHLHRPHVGHRAAVAISQHHLTPLQFRQIQLDRQMLRDAQMHRATVGQG